MLACASSLHCRFFCHFHDNVAAAYETLDGGEGGGRRGGGFTCRSKSFDLGRSRFTGDTDGALNQCWRYGAGFWDQLVPQLYGGWRLGWLWVHICNDFDYFRIRLYNFE